MIARETALHVDRSEKGLAKMNICRGTEREKGKDSETGTLKKETDNADLVLIGHKKIADKKHDQVCNIC